MTLSKKTRRSVVERLKHGDSTSEILKHINIGKGTVSRIRKENPSIKTKPNRPGRKPILSERDDRIIERLALSREDNAPNKLAQVLESFQNNDDDEEDNNNNIGNQRIKITPSLIRRSLIRSGFESVSLKKKRKIELTRFKNKEHSKARHKFFEKTKSWEKEQWRNVLWSGEKRIFLPGSNPSNITWLPEEFQKQTTNKKKYTDNFITVWGCIGWNGVGRIVLVDGNFDSDKYIEILSRNLIQSAELLGLSKNDLIFMQGNDPRHTARKTIEWIESQDISMLEGWPSGFQNLNPLEKVWKSIKRELEYSYSESAQNRAELWGRAQSEWEKFGEKNVGLIQESIDQLPDLLKEGNRKRDKKKNNK